MGSSVVLEPIDSNCMEKKSRVNYNRT